MTAVLHVCTTCRAGRRLHDALLAAGAPEGVTIRAAECLSACDHGCNVALTRPGAWSYVYGRLSMDDIPEILRGAGLYAATADGIVPWRERPVISYNFV